MSDTIDLKFLGKVVARLQSSVESVRQDYGSIRASLTSMDTRFAEFNLRLSSFELSQMRLAASLDDAHTKIDRLEIEFERLSERLGEVAERQTGMTVQLEGMQEQMARAQEQQTGMDAKLDLLLARLGDR